MGALLRFLVLPAWCASLAGCPALLPDDFAIAEDVGAPEAGLAGADADADAGFYDVGSSPLNPIPTCDAMPEINYQDHVPEQYCSQVAFGYYSTVAEFIADTQGVCTPAGLDGCECDYTCACALAPANIINHQCVCHQAAPGAPIVLTGCGI